MHKQDLDPKTWGPAAWTFLHWAAARADVNHEQSKLFSFMRTLTRFLPCSKCRTHLKQNINNIQWDPANASRTIYQLHNLVNHQNGKDDFTCFSRVRRHYMALARQDPPLKIWPFLYSVATYCDAAQLSDAQTVRFWKQLGRLLPESWGFEFPISEESYVKRLHAFHKNQDPAALPLPHYIQRCQSGC